MIIVTGAAGFIGSNLVKALNAKGIYNIILVDDINNSNKKNIKNLIYKKKFSINNFMKIILLNDKILSNVKCIFHQGACSNTMENRVNFIFKNNFVYSKILFDFSMKKKIKFIYASSASVYGLSKNSTENNNNEDPLNLYAISKLMFDNYVLLKSNNLKNQVVGLRYFNVYGPNEKHKKNMSSVIYHFCKQSKHSNYIKIFDKSHGYKAGEQKRDFIHVDDVISVNLWFMNNNKSGLFNVGTGVASSFNKVAILICSKNSKLKNRYIKFPNNLRNAYQPYTKANLKNLRNIGYKKDFISIKEGINRYLNEI